MKKFVLCLLIVLLFSSAAIAEEETVLTYRSLGKGLYRLGNTGYIVEHPTDYIRDPHMMNNIKQNIKQYNTYIPATENINKYLYFVESSRSADISSDLSGENEVFCSIRDQLVDTTVATLALDDYTQYIDWFYRTDHHWNYKGSYKAYCDLIDMLFGPEENKIEPIETVTFDELPFNGSYHSKLGYTKSSELFTVYRFPDFVPYTTTTNGYPDKSYGNYARYFAGKYAKLTVYNHYGAFYGGDKGELILQTNRPELKRLLIFSNSYSNAVTLPLLQHYDAIYSIDTRFYKGKNGNQFDVQKYIHQNEIDDVLILGDVHFFMKYFELSGY